MIALESSRSSCALMLAVVRLHSVLSQYEFCATKELGLAEVLGGPFVFSWLAAKPEVSVVLGALDESRTRPVQMGDEEACISLQPASVPFSTGVGSVLPLTRGLSCSAVEAVDERGWCPSPLAVAVDSDWGGDRSSKAR